MTGLPAVPRLRAPWMPDVVVDAIASFSFITHFEGISKGLLDARNDRLLRFPDRVLPVRQRPRARRQEGPGVPWTSGASAWWARSSPLVLFFAVNVLTGAALRHRAHRPDEREASSRCPRARRASPAASRSRSGSTSTSRRTRCARSRRSRTTASAVRDVLESYVRHSEGNLVLEVIDPEPFSEAEERAVREGISRRPARQRRGRSVLRSRRHERDGRPRGRPVLQCDGPGEGALPRVRAVAPDLLPGPPRQEEGRASSARCRSSAARPRRPMIAPQGGPSAALARAGRARGASSRSRRSPRTRPRSPTTSTCWC